MRDINIYCLIYTSVDLEIRVLYLRLQWPGDRVLSHKIKFLFVTGAVTPPPRLEESDWLITYTGEPGTGEWPPNLTI